MKAVKSFRNERPQKRVQTNEEIAASLGVNVSYIAEFREIFRLIDIDDSDTLSVPELRILFEVTGCCLVAEEMTIFVI
jgi:hypothetical protein